MKVSMSTCHNELTNNQRLRELVKKTGLTQVVAQTIFNRGLGSRACTTSTWKAFFLDSQSSQFQEICDELLQHAEKVFEKHIHK